MFVNQFPKLKETSRLTSEANRVIIYKVDQGDAFISLDPMQAVILACCNGDLRVNQLYDVVMEVYEYPLSDAVIFVDELLSHISEHLDMLNEKIEGVFRYDPSSFMFDPSDTPWNNKLEIPNSLEWRITDINTSQKFSSNALEFEQSQLSKAQAFKLFEECASLGIQHVHINGEDLFLRTGFIDIIQFLLDKKIHLDISTNKVLQQPLLARLAHAGLKTLQLNLHGTTEVLDDGIEDSESRLHKIQHMLVGANKCDLNIRVKIQVTAKNITDIPDLIENLIDFNVKDIVLAGNFLNENQIGSPEFITQNRMLAMVRHVCDIGERNSGVKLDMVALTDPHCEILEEDETGISTNFKTCLIVAANGDCIIGDQENFEQSAKIGNVKMNTLKRIWQSDKPNALLEPYQEFFQQTSQMDCVH